MKKLALILLTLLIQACATTGLQDGNGDKSETALFRHFVRDFFSDPDFQLEHIKFPLEFINLSDVEDDHRLMISSISKSDWKFLTGPEYYKCKVNCYDLVIYDNFAREHQASGKRVLSFEGVSNGINSSLYFELIDGEWYLVKYEQLGT